MNQFSKQVSNNNILFCLIGIFLITTRFWFAIGHINIDLSNDIIAYVLIIIGILPVKNRNSRFKKSFIISILGLLGAAVSQFIMAFNWNEAQSTMNSIAIGISVVFAIYFSYYFTEALVMESKVQERQAVTRNYQLTWFLLAAAVFVHYFAFMSTISTASIVLEAVIAIIAIYYSYSVFCTSIQLFED